MSKLLLILNFLFLIPYPAESQVLPGEGSKLHYRIIGFSVEPVPQAVNYTIEIAAGNYFTEDSFKKNIIQSLASKSNKIIAEVPSFGGQYTWRIAANKEKNNSKLILGGLHHFSIGMSPHMDTNIVRFRITKPAEKYKDAYIFLDGTRALYDMKGRPVWYLPDVKGIKNDDNIEMGDLKPTSKGTITFILGSQACEINYTGDLLWKGPDNGIISGDTLEHYHHEFTRLNNGHYMVMGIETVLWKLNTLPEKNYHLPMLSGKQINQDSINSYVQKGYLPLPFATILEYDEKGNLVWSWRPSKYFKDADTKYYKEPRGMGGFDPHMNGFFFDEKNKELYISCRDISRIIKVKYPEGTVIANYGEIYKPNAPVTGNKLFCEQHSCRISDKGSLYLFNNNTCNRSQAIPTILVMEEPKTGTGKLKKIWEYDCKGSGENVFPIYNTGGNVFELPDHSFFVCMGKQYGSTFIVSQDKKILWSGIAEKRNPETGGWDFISLYRASIIPDRKELERFIWNDENASYPKK